MTLTVVSTDRIGSSIQVELIADSDGAYIRRDVLVASSEQIGVFARESSQSVVVDGDVVGAAAGVKLGLDELTDSDNSLYVSKTGSIKTNGSIAVEVSSYSVNIFNAGEIYGGAGIRLLGSNESSTSVITNSGRIDGISNGIFQSFGSSETIVIRNTGVISGEFASFNGGSNDAIQRIHNDGLMQGDVILFGGDDVYNGTGGSVIGVVRGGLGNDTLRGGTGDEIFDGDFDDDFINGGGGADTMTGGLGDDVFVVDDEGDVVIEVAGQGADEVRSSVSYTMTAGIERLVLTGSAAIDATGNASRGTIVGNRGDNVISGLGGIDMLIGGKGRDTFVFDSNLNAASNVDTITDFNLRDDLIELDTAIFGEIAGSGALTAGQFRANAAGAAGDADDRIIYETDTGRLFYDRDGNGAAAAVQFALIENLKAITAADFVVV